MSSITPAPGGAGHRRLYCRRSRNGCMTCKRRKVRCNERRPQCYHCQRLSLECVWKDDGPQRSSPSRNADVRDMRDAPVQNNFSALELNRPSASADPFGFAQPTTDPADDFALFQDLYLPDLGDFPQPRAPLHERVLSIDLDATGSPIAPPQASHHPLTANVDVEESLQLHVPPMLEPVENGPKWASVRALLDGMAASSPMVRYSIAAFETIQFSAGKKVDYRKYYDKAANELSERFYRPGGAMVINSNELRYVLATIFFLTYINFLTGRLDLAYLNLARAHNALQTSGRGTLGSLEQRIVSWIRLSDARAASAGGEGLLVNDTSGIYLSATSPASSSAESQSSGSVTNPGSHEVIYDVLCQPGIAFFQEVQTITGRITRIAHHHRSRGTVEDETEVMAIAADILKDLSSIYDRRPALMDHAVSGNIGEDTLAKPLASAIIRSFQTYLANFYACYIHLHRVAHRHLARSKSVITALGKIKEMMHFMVTNSDESVPVNMLWPLFLWGSEEDDYDECQWILETIRSLQHVATNANMTADVLQETQKRQHEAGARVDTRSVCLELFNATFAIV